MQKVPPLRRHTHTLDVFRAQQQLQDCGHVVFSPGLAARGSDLIPHDQVHICLHAKPKIRWEPVAKEVFIFRKWPTCGVTGEVIFKDLALQWLLGYGFYRREIINHGDYGSESSGSLLIGWHQGGGNWSVHLSPMSAWPCLVWFPCFSGPGAETHT